MIISIINHTSGKIADEEVHRACRAINRQIAEDFEPYWSMGATLRLEGWINKDPNADQALWDMRGDGVIYLWDGNDVEGALGYHDRNFLGISYGFVFTDLMADLGEPWSVTLSHEALELLADPDVNLLVQGPHPTEDRTVFHWFEMCDAVQAETYKVDGVDVSNFLLPLYFTEDSELGSRNDFLGRKHDGHTLRSFGINPGGYVGFFDPEIGDHSTYAMPDDAVAQKRLEVKSSFGRGRRSVRYKEGFTRERATK